MYSDATKFKKSFKEFASFQNFPEFERPYFEGFRTAFSNDSAILLHNIAILV